MNKIKELHSLPKGTECEISGIVTYEGEPKPVKFGSGLNQFVVVQDDAQGGINSVGVNISLSDPKDGYSKGENVKIVGKIDKYPDRKQPLRPDGTYPVKTSFKATSVERIVQAQEFRDESEYSEEDATESVMSEKDVSEVNKPAKDYVFTKNMSEEEKRIMWEKKDLIVAKESACKTVGGWIETGKIELKNYFAWVEKLVDYFYSEDSKFGIITQANLMASGLVTVTKAEALTWIKGHMWDTEHATEEDLIKALHVKPLSTQLLPELLETIEKLSLILQ